MATANNPIGAEPKLAAPAQRPRARWRQWLYRLSALTIAPLLFLGLMEIILRLCGYGYPASFFVPRREIDGREVYVENRHFGRHFFPRGLARTPEPCSFPAYKSANTYRIFILGESAALGYPDPSVNFGRILAVMLKDGYPDINFEIVNTAMTAINSHVILPIARAGAGHEPDLFVVYMGNNEVVGPYGNAGVLGPHVPSLALIRASVRAKSLRLGQFLSNQMQWAAGADKTSRWEGMVMFAKSQVAADDPRMAAIYGNFASNLQDICGSGIGAGAKVVVCTVATNLKDSAPFASAPSANLASDQAAAWQEIYDRGVRLETAGDGAGAMAEYRRAAAIDGKVADLHFRLGRCLAAIGKGDEARAHFSRARDLDTLRFRADTRINEAIRTVGANKEGDGIYLADVERAFAAACDGVAPVVNAIGAPGIPGENLFYEHVHMNFDGNYILARTVCEQVKRILPAAVAAHGAAAMLAKEECMERLAFGDWKKLKALEVIAAIVQDPPFSGQLDGAARNERLQRQLEALRKRFQTDGLKDSVALFRRALERADDDVELHRDFAQLLLRHGEMREAIPHLQKVVRAAPSGVQGYVNLAFAVKSLGHFDQALALCADASRLDADQAEPHNMKGAIFMELGKIPEAIAAFSQAAKIDANDDKPWFNLGLALAENGQLDEAIAAYEKSLALMPKNAPAHLKLAEALARRQQSGQAIAHLEEALRMQPGWPEAMQMLNALRPNKNGLAK